jgi:hypothetical protein
MTDDERATLRAVYGEICKTHNAIADFRAKLLYLLPIASGASVFLLLGKLKGDDRRLLVAVGVFGFVVTIGLFMYELRGIEDCSVLRRRGEAIEMALGVQEPASQFRRWYGGKRNVVDEIGAAWIVYVAVLAAWAFVVGAGVESFFKKGWPTWLAFVLGAVLLAVAIAVVVVALLHHDSWTERRPA